MAIAFLGVTRRERASVIASTDFTIAKQMAVMASERAAAEVVSRMVRDNALGSIDLLVSTNYYNPTGFLPGVANAGNVNYFQRNNGADLNNADLIQNIANLQIDPRPPVFYQSIVNRRPTNEFRFFLDINRNRAFEDTGVIQLIRNGRLSNEFQLLSGDPQWIGVLENPDFPHSATNRFIGRYLFYALPTGRSLDINYIHNQVKQANLGGQATAEGYYRNQGAGAWEINLAAFLHELNTNFWDYNYNTNLVGSSFGRAFTDSLDLMLYRLTNITTRTGGYLSLSEPINHFASTVNKVGLIDAFRDDGSDNFGDGLLTTATGDEDEPVARKWFGSDSPQIYYDPQELFTAGRPYSLTSGDTSRGGFAWRMTASMTNLLNNDSENRYTFYKMLSQLGVDSLPANRDRIHLNYDNRSQLNRSVTLPVGDTRFRTSEFLPWNPQIQFLEVADRMLKERFRILGRSPNDISITNISIYPNFNYGPEIHQVLQMCANIVDANYHGNITESRQIRLSDNSIFTFPMVFRPVFGRLPDSSIAITNWLMLGERGLDFITNQPWYDLSRQQDVSQLQSSLNPNGNIYGVPYVIAARQNVPNFNEVLFETHATVTRKVIASKRSPFETFDRPKVFQQLHFLSLSNVVGLESWNSARTAFPREVTLGATNIFGVGIYNQNGLIRSREFLRSNVESIPADGWPGSSDATFTTTAQKDASFRMPLLGYFVSATNELYIRNSLLSTNNIVFESELTPLQVSLATTNRVTYYMADRATGHILDFVNLSPMTNIYNLSGELQQQSNFWLTNSFNYERSTVPVNEGIMNQINESLSGAANDWRPHSQDPIAGDDKAKAIEGFRDFMGINTTGIPSIPRTTTTMQLPYSPTSKFRWRSLLQANDPLVHYTLSDLMDVDQPGDQAQFIPLTQMFSQNITNNNLLALNDRFNPWGGNPSKSQAQASSNASNDPRNPALKDPSVTEPSLFQLPAYNRTLGYKYPNIGALGAIHRGTPWQTIYLKSEGPGNNKITLRQWRSWTGHPFPQMTHPTNDWSILSHFTTSLNDNSSRGLLSVNQTNRAAWSAILGGIRLKSVADAEIEDRVITPATSEIYNLIDGINLARQSFPPQRQGGLSLFPYLGGILAAPELTISSPYLGSGMITDETMEAIPRQMLSLVKDDDPRIVVYAYGQALRPADRSVVGTADQFNGLVTNYVPTSEYVTKTLIEFYTDSNGVLRHRTESFSVVSPTE
ncbi:MAG: hypothetical protein LR011_02145 [Verrucomicrobia bacterium]|nr:hypothetical protein [Verrucomicrobiota bacterium]